VRPISRGAKPAGLTIRRYNDAWLPLKTAIGEYCSYCEKPLTDVIEIEHVKPKKVFPAEAIKWENLLLSCKFCNTIKGKKPTDDIGNYIWPHLDNPLLVLNYLPGQVPIPYAGITPAQLDKANKSIELVGLQRTDKSMPKAGKTDNRFAKRNEAWIIAESVRKAFISDPGLMNSNPYMELLQTTIKLTGFFSVWWNAFANFPAIRHMLVGLFPGTDHTRFDAQCNAI
jgi:uncharacterized protein (TIGR02646 family)